MKRHSAPSLISEQIDRAPKGGAIGVNGANYEGGQFLPGSPNTVKGEFKSGGSGVGRVRKEQIEPYVWAEPPSPQHRAINTFLGGTLA